MELKRRIDILILGGGLFLIEMLFRQMAFTGSNTTAVFRSFFFDFGLGLLLSLISSRLSGKKARWFFFAVLFLAGSYAFLQLEFHHFLDNYYSVAAASDELGRVSAFIRPFLADALPVYYLCLLPAVLSLFLRHPEPSVPKKELWLPLASGVLCILLAFSSITVLPPQNNLRNAYRHSSNPELLMNRIGVFHFLVRDVASLLDHSEEQLQLIETTVQEKTETAAPTAEPIQEPAVDDTVRRYDDSVWKAAMENEENETLSSIDHYLLSRPISDKNESTGIYEGYNFIYILVESLDYTAIDPELTPTLYRMYNEGTAYERHYAPKYSCTTGESEFIALTSLVPYSDVCTPNVAQHNAYPEALPNLFKNKGYFVSSYHNWDDQYYDRHTELVSFGFNSFKDVYELEIPLIQGWQSDKELVEKAVPYFIEEEPFFTYLISSSMHWPYDEASTLGNRYLSEVQKVHPDYSLDLQRYLSKCMEFDKAMERLLEILEERGIAEKTVICLYGDHRPFKLQLGELAKQTKLIERDGEFYDDLVPFFHYCPGQEGKKIDTLCSTFDHVPTLANLFGLEYDPRLYIGNDILDGNCQVIFPNGDWISEEGVYMVYSDEFVPYPDQELSEAELASLQARSRNATAISRAIMNEDYFAKRPFLPLPTEE
ncbi:MAG: sulfatase-like hydrolase/transferase [Erysipelotrichaceae bacterium]|nr:sulfatase-like hydrolase/transferase [Erysipelotrichaceae bacterium]